MKRFITSPLTRRSVLAGAAGLAFAACSRTPDEPAADAAGADPDRIADLKGRPAPDIEGDGLSIDDGRFLIALALIHPDPVSRLAAWAGDINRIGPELYQDYVARFPALETLPRVSSSAEAFAMEPLLAAGPAAAVFSLGAAGPTDAQVSQLQAAGIESVFIDFFNSPFTNQAKSLSLLGYLVGRSEQAEAYNAFRAQRLETIASRVAGLAPDQRPTVLLEAHAGMTPDCCNSPGKGNVGDYIEFVGGHNIGADVLDAPSGKLNMEYVIERDPDVYIATGGPHLEAAGGFVTGPGFSDAQARDSLRRMAARQGIASLTAVQTGRVHGLAHQIINSPIDIVATEALARWIHPDLFADIDPRATLDEINNRFLAVPYHGEYWTSLGPA